MMSAMRPTSGLDSGWNTMISSSLLRNSGRYFAPSSRLTSACTFWYVLPAPLSPWSMDRKIAWEPTLEVMMSMALVKSTVLPFESVSRPSSSTWSKMLKTSGCAFSISSRRTSVCGLRRTASVSCPPSAKPTYPGGGPTSLDTAKDSMYSLMSIRTMLFSAP